MEIMALNGDFQPEGPTSLKYFDLAWNRKYYETGQFSVQIRADDYSREMAYIFAAQRPELGMIQKVVYEDEDGMVVLSGFFYERKLADRIVWPTFERYGTRAGFVATAVEAYRGDIPKLKVADFEDDGEKVHKQETGASLEEMAHETLQTEGKAYRCRYDFEKDVVLFEIYKGVDRTQGQDVNNFVTFSRGFRNIKNVKAQNDSSAYKNYFVVAGQGEGDDRITAVLDLSEGGYHRELFLESKKIYNPGKQTIDEYKNILRQVAVEKSAKYVSIDNVEFDAVADTGAVYLEDYDLGDKCDIILDQLGKSYETRIIEIMETWTGGVHRVTLTFGDKIPTMYEKARIK